MQHFFFTLINISLINTMYIYHQTFSVDASRVPRVWQQRSKSQRQALNLIFFFLIFKVLKEHISEYDEKSLNLIRLESTNIYIL